MEVESVINGQSKIIQFNILTPESSPDTLISSSGTFPLSQSSNNHRPTPYLEDFPSTPIFHQPRLKKRPPLLKSKSSGNILTIVDIPGTNSEVKYKKKKKEKNSVHVPVGGSGPPAGPPPAIPKAHDIFLLSGLALGAVNWNVWHQCTPKQMWYYLPLFIRVLPRSEILPEEFYHGILANFSNSTDKSIRQLTYWMCKCEMFPVDSKNKFKIEDDQIEMAKFFEGFQTKHLKVGDKRQFLTPCCDPVFGILMHELEVLQLFKAHTRPALCEVTLINNDKVRFIYKEGDDLRDDMYTQTMFHIFNQIWEYSGMSRKPFIHLYRVFPTALDKGFVEYVPSATLQNYDWSKLNQFNEKQKEEFICSAAGAFAGAFILGIRDRHRDNMMISDQGHFFHIDFGYMFNNKTWFDANRFAIPSEIRLQLLDMWDGFLELIGESYRMLRRHRGMISYFVTKLFAGEQKFAGIKKYKEFQIIKCLSGAFYDMQTEDEAVLHIREIASKGEASPKKAIKDLVHKFESKKKKI